MAKRTMLQGLLRRSGAGDGLHSNCLNKKPHSRYLTMRMGVGSHTFGTHAILTAVFRGIYQSLQANSGTALRIG